MAIVLNPGFALLIGAALALAAPAGWRAGAMALSAAAAILMMVVPDFGEQIAIARTGIVVTPVQLDALSQIFGLAAALAALVLALFSGVRADRVEDCAFMVHAGGAVVAMFAGDLISYVAAAETSLLAAAFMVMRARRGLRAGLRLLGWFGAAGALFTAGAGLLWAQRSTLSLDQFDAATPGGACLLIGLLIVVGAPGAHVWVKDAIPRASPLGAAALATFPIPMALSVLARSFPGEPALIWIGVVMALAALPLAAGARDVRAAMAYGVVSQAGVALVGLGAATPLAIAGATAFAFACTLHNALGFMTVGAAIAQAEAGKVPARGLARSMPITAGLAVVAGLSAMAAPGLAGFGASALLSDAIANESRTIVYWALVAAGAGAVLHLGLRAPFEVFFGPDRGARPAEPPFTARLGMALAAFFIVAIGVDPGWLFRLAPVGILFHPYDRDHLLAQAQLLTFASLAFALSWRLRRAPPAGVWDLDGLMFGPGGMLGRALVRAAAAANQRAQAAADAAWRATKKHALRVGATADRPSRPGGAPGAWILAVAAFMVLVLYIFQR